MKPFYVARLQRVWWVAVGDVVRWCMSLSEAFAIASALQSREVS